MKPIKGQINLRVVNNTALPQPVSILGVVANNNSANNSNILYEFNLTGQSFTGITNLNISISNTSNPTVVVNSAQVLTENIQGVVDALNTLNQGIFSYSGNIIYVSSSYYIYGALEIISNIFISVWTTSNTSGGSSSANQIQLPLEAIGNYNFVVDWGDGSQDTITLWNQAETLHTYSIAGTYTINITGTIQGFTFNGIGDRDKLISINNWGILNLGNSGNYFSGCSNLDLSIVDDVLDLAGTTDLSNMFKSCTSITTINNVNSWNLSNVIVIDSLFEGATLFNDDISSWDVSSVIGMSLVFQSTSNFNQPLNSWNVSNVTQMGGMFSGASSFNQPLSSWNVSSVLNMNGMFAFATAFNQNISAWNVSNVGSFGTMFFSASNFNQPLNSWNVSNATLMFSMFSSATSFNQPLSSWNVSNVQNMSAMFQFASSFNQNISAWNVGNVTNFSNMFRNATIFNQPLNSWNVSSATNMSLMFQSATAFNQALNSWNVSNVQNMLNMFTFASNFNQPLNSWNVSSVQNMQQMFRNATAFDQNIGSWNILNVTNFTGFMLSKTNLNYSTTNLDAIYNGWSLLTVQPSIIINFGTIKYTLAGQGGKNILTGVPNNWLITDGGI